MTASHENLSASRKIWNLLSRRERKYALILLMMMFVGMCLETLGIGMVIPAIVLITHEDVGASYPIIRPVLVALGNPSQGTLIVGGMFTLVAIYLVKALYLGVLAWLQGLYQAAVKVRLSQRLFTTYLRQPISFHLQRNSAQLIRNAVAEANQLAMSGLGAAMRLCTDGLLLLGIGALLLLVEPLGALIISVVLGSTAWGFQRITRARVIAWGEARRYHEVLRIQHIQQGLGGAKDIKLLGRESDFLEQFYVHTVHAARATRLMDILRQVPRLGLELLAVLGLAILVLIMLVQERELATIMPTLGLFGVAAFRLLPSVNRVLGAIQELRFSVPVIDNLYEELQLAAPALPARGVKPTRELRQEIRLTDVSYVYAGASIPALNEVSFSIRQGETVGLIGPSGSGKSTLVDVLLGLLTPTAGYVTVDGHDIHESLRPWQDQIGYVSQSIYLTDDSLRRNVAFAVPSEDIDDEGVRRAIEAAQLKEFVASLPNGVESVVGERGIRLSGGQRQRIGIARALYHDPGVLVLDEATSSLDTATEQGVMRAVVALQASKTILIVAHRLSTVKHCDRLYRLEKGYIVEEGPPSTILSSQAEQDSVAEAAGAHHR